MFADSLILAFVRFRVGGAGNGDVAPPGWRGFGEEVPGTNPEKNADNMKGVWNGSSWQRETENE